MMNDLLEDEDLTDQSISENHMRYYSPGEQSKIDYEDKYTD